MCLIFENFEFLRYIVPTDSVSVQTSKINTIRDWLAPASITELYCFLGLMNYHFWFI